MIKIFQTDSLITLKMTDAFLNQATNFITKHLQLTTNADLQIQNAGLNTTKSVCRKSLKADALILLLSQILKTALQITKEPLQL